jgi:hypothetical protein
VPDDRGAKEGGDDYSDDGYEGTQYSQPSGAVTTEQAPQASTESTSFGPEAELIARLKKLVSMKQTKIKVLLRT